MKPDAAQVADAASAIGEGQVVCFPTETSYGLAVDIRDHQALARLVALKGRDSRSPFGLIAGDAQAARGLALHWPKIAESLAAAHWPGPLTLVMAARPGLPAEILGSGGGVGVRVSSHPWASALAQAVGAPITATSANPSGAVAARSVDQARAYFGARVAFYLDAGPSPECAPSTLASIADDGTLTVLRPGPIELS